MMSINSPANRSKLGWREFYLLMNTPSPRRAVKIADRIRAEEPGKFFELITMHLSFLLDVSALGTDLTTGKWTEGERGKLLRSFMMKKQAKGLIFGQPLTEEGVAQIQQLIEFLGCDCNVREEGLFRKSGNKRREEKLIKVLDEGREVDLFRQNDYTAHDCANVLKMFLGALPEPLVMERNYRVLHEIQRLTNDDKQLKALQLIILSLPKENQRLLQAVLRLLRKVANSTESRMTASSLGTIFAPQLLVPKQVPPCELQMYSLASCVAFMVDHVEEIFMMPPELAQDFMSYDRRRTGCDASFEGVLTPKRHALQRDDAVDTCITFVDREAYAAASKDTDVALAELYATVARMPESEQKRKLIKKMNRANVILAEKKCKTSLRARLGLKKKRSTDHLKKEDSIQDENSVRLQVSSADKRVLSPSVMSPPLSEKSSNYITKLEQTMSPSTDFVTCESRIATACSPVNNQLRKTRSLGLEHSCFRETKPSSILSPISSTLKAIPESIQKNLATPGNRKGIMFVQSPSSFLETSI